MASRCERCCQQRPNLDVVRNSVRNLGTRRQPQQAYVTTSIRSCTRSIPLVVEIPGNMALGVRRGETTGMGPSVTVRDSRAASGEAGFHGRCHRQGAYACIIHLYLCHAITAFQAGRKWLRLEKPIHLSWALKRNKKKEGEEGRREEVGGATVSNVTDFVVTISLARKKGYYDKAAESEVNSTERRGNR
uniref:Uncharacterized protein n=1 Tax=Oryza punctata TaxID=4537 RepID=A0A0E0M2R7_ORYPU